MVDMFYFYYIIGFIIVFIVFVYKNLDNFKEYCVANKSLIDIKLLWSSVVNLSFVIACSFIWPIIVYWVIEDLYEKKKEKDAKFKLETKDLSKKIDRSEIEKKEIVFDPLNAAPSVPFGHLNRIWLKFCDELDPNDELWTFEVTWHSPWGTKDFYAGYAAVRNGVIKSYFLIK